MRAAVREIERRLTRRVLRALRAGGYEVAAADGDGDIAWGVDERGMMALCMDLDDAWIVVRRPGEAEHCGWVKLVYGNDTGWDLISDYTVNLDPEIEPIIEEAVLHL